MSSCCAPGKEPANVPAATQLPTPGVDPSPSEAAELATVPGGPFTMGYDGPLLNPGEGEGPERMVDVPGFRISPTTVTVAQFAAFVAATGYVTEAERCGWSFVFYALVAEGSQIRGRVEGAEWWCAVDGADWRNPHGPGAATDDGPNAFDEHPVVHVSAADAEAYCAWADLRLPTEAEWEKAARGGLERALFPWGDEPPHAGPVRRCNIWEGDFPVSHARGSHAIGTEPARTFEPNEFGLYQAVGNVWEWTADPWVQPDRDRRTRNMTDRNDLDGHRVRRGGSYLCHDSYCNRYRVSARDHSHRDDTTGNLGFRVAL